MHHTSSAIPLSSLGKLPMTVSDVGDPLTRLPDLEECGWRFVWEVVVMANMGRLSKLSALGCDSECLPLVVLRSRWYRCSPLAGWRRS